MDEIHYREAVSHASYGAPPHGMPTIGDSLVKLVAASVLTRSGEPYFDSLLRLLSAQFELRLALVGVVDRESHMVETLVNFEHGRRAENFHYELQGTPCETVMSPRSICVYARNVAELFPRDTTLDEIDAEGYVGMPLLDREGEMIGLMALITSSPLEDAESVAGMLKVFGRRSSLELEHLVAVRRACASAEVLAEAAESEEFTLADFIRRIEA